MLRARGRVVVALPLMALRCMGHACHERACLSPTSHVRYGSSPCSCSRRLNHHFDRVRGVPLVLIPYLYRTVSIVAHRDDRGAAMGDRARLYLTPVRPIALYRRLG